ncbi:MAG TPA: hypothetical protein VIG37_01295 [Methylomirabilota bacterium]|jgi:hypothetical protein
MLRGFVRIDRRSLAARGVLKWQQQIVAECGGEAALTPIRRARIETASRTKLLLDHIDSHLLEPRTLFARKGRLRKDVRSLLDLRQRMAADFERALAAIGTVSSKSTAPLPSIDELVAQEADAVAVPEGVRRGPSPRGRR